MQSTNLGRFRFCTGFWTPAITKDPRAGRRPKKRQGTKSREVWNRQGNERYEDCMFPPLSTVSATRARGDVMSAYRGTEESAVGISAGARSAGGW